MTATPAGTGSIPERVLSVDEWNEKSNIKFFKRYEGPFRVKQITFANHPVRKIMERHFEYMSRNLYFISAFGRFLLGHTKEEDVIKAEDIAARTISKATESMRKRVAQARTLIKDAGNEEEETHFSKSQTMGVPITTPGAALYAELLRITDEFYTLNYSMWLDGEIDSRVKFKNESDARREIQGVIKGIASQFMFILNLTRRKDTTEAGKAGVHDEAKLEQDAVLSVEVEIGSNSMTNNIPAVASDSASNDAETTTAGKRSKKAAVKPAEEPAAAVA